MVCMAIKTRQQLAKEAILIQDACNPSGVAHFLREVFNQLVDEGADTKAKCEDPLVRLTVHKLADLCHMNNDLENENYHNAYMAAKEMADEV